MHRDSNPFPNRKRAALDFVAAALACALSACSQSPGATASGGSSGQTAQAGAAGQSTSGTSAGSGAEDPGGGASTGGAGLSGAGMSGAGASSAGTGAGVAGASSGGATSSAGGSSGGAGSGAAGSATGGSGGTSTSEPPPGTTPPITPRWAFEPWAWEDNTNTRQSAETLIKDYTDRAIPVGAIIIDSPWETAYNTLLWDTTRYPSPTAMISGFHAQGVKVLLWITAFVDTDASDYASAKQQKYGVNSNANATWWKGTGLHVDITNPAAAAWWNAQLGARLADGIDGWKLDRGADYIGDPVKTSAGSLAITDFKKRLSADFFDYTTTTNPNAIICVRPFDAV